MNLIGFDFRIGAFDSSRMWRCLDDILGNLVYPAELPRWALFSFLVVSRVYDADEYTYESTVRM